MQDVWEKAYIYGNKNVEIFIGKLKGKFEDIQKNLETIKGFGYRLNN